MGDFYWLDRVQDTTQTTGAGDLILAGATERMLGIGDAGIADGGGFLALIEHQEEGKNEWELVPCTYNAAGAGSISRGTPRKSSLGTSTVTFSAGLKTISLVEIAGVRLHACRSVASGSSTDMADGDDTLIVDKSVGGAHAVALPPNPLPGQCVRVMDGKGDAGTNPITITGDAINGATSVSIETDYGFIDLIRAPGNTKWLVIG